MASFPRLKTGATAQYGCERIVKHPVTLQRFTDGTAQRFARERAKRAWLLRLDGLSAQEAETIESFIATHLETQERFSFTDPWSGLEYSGCEVPSSGYRVLAESEHGHRVDVLIEQRQV